MKIISSKSIFAFLIVIIILNFIINGISIDDRNSNNKVLNKEVINTQEKMIGVKIQQQNNKGEKFLIIADSLIENNSEDKKVILENSITTIERNGIFTNITAGHAIISNDYDDFDFSDKVKITKKIRKFILKTESLAGTFKEGNYYTDDDVKIVSSNTTIEGKGLYVKNNGEYIKIEGKAKLNMLLTNKE